MKPKNNNMVNGINMKVLKGTVSVLAHPMAKIMSNSIEAGIFPSNLRDAEVVPLFKKGCKDNPSNYRPILLLSPFSKVYEKFIEGQLRVHMEGEGQLSSVQHGYREGHSTDSMSIPLLEDLAKALEEKETISSVSGLLQGL